MRRVVVSDTGAPGGAGTAEDPCDSLTTAIKRARGTGAKRIEVAAGRYRITSPIRLTPSDSGLHISGAGPDRTVIDGGVEITDWTRTQFNGKEAFQADVRSLLDDVHDEFRSLFVRGERRPRSRWPVSGFLQLKADGTHTKENRFHGTRSPSLFDPTQVPSEFTLSGAELRVLHKWVDERMPIRSWNSQTGQIECTIQSVQRMTGQSSGWQAERAFLENVPEAVTLPGQWYLDRKRATLTVLVTEDERLDGFTAVAPVVSQFVRFEGRSPDGGSKVIDPVADVSIEGIGFEHSDWVQPTDDVGLRFDPYLERTQWTGRDSYHYVIDRFLGSDTAPRASAFQAAFTTPGAITLFGAHDCFITRCAVRHAGFYGVELADGCRNNEVSDNILADLGGGGVNVDGGNRPAEPDRHVYGNQLLRNEICGVGRVFLSSCGVFIGYGSGNEVSSNHIHDLRYTGISIGWTWDRAPQQCRDNLIANNCIHDINGTDVLSDLGGIYTLGIQPGTFIRANSISSVMADAYGACGIYTDAATAGVAVEANRIADIAEIGINVNAENCENVYRGNLISGVQIAAFSINRDPHEFRKRHGELGRAATIVGNRCLLAGAVMYRFAVEPGVFSTEELAAMIWAAANTVCLEATSASSRSDLSSDQVAARSLTGEALYSWDEWLAAGQDAGTVLELESARPKDTNGCPEGAFAHRGGSRTIGP